MKLVINNLRDGKYGLSVDSKLEFEGKFIEYIRPGEKGNLYTSEIVIDKKSALEIATTLFDSMDMLSKEVEELLCDIEEKINGN